MTRIIVRQTGAKGYSWEARCTTCRDEFTYLTHVGAVALNTRGVGNRKWEHAMLAAWTHLKERHPLIKGMGSLPYIRARRDAILTVLAQADSPLPTQEIANRLNIKGMSYGKVYQDLRIMCGSHGSGLTYAEIDAQPDFNMPGYPVIWRRWNSEASNGGTTWSITDEECERRSNDVANLEKVLGMES